MNCSRLNGTSIVRKLKSFTRIVVYGFNDNTIIFCEASDNAIILREFNDSTAMTKEYKLLIFLF